MSMYRFETFLRKVRHLKYLDTRFGKFNEGFTSLLCNTKESDKIYVHLCDELFDLSVQEFIEDIEDALMIEDESVQYSIDYLIYDACFGTQGMFWLPDDEEGYDCTVWNTYCDLTGVLTKDICDSFENPKFIV